ncbi:MAG: phosphoenolpyruvate synthase, partial [Rhodobacter sp.]|nr:phosphoenolpyruvate synthase [Rhodobacter sp.]
MTGKRVNVMWFEELTRGDVALVGGKNSSLGEMVRQLGQKGIRVPSGFATTADAYRTFLTANGLDARIDDVIGQWQDHRITLHEAGSRVRAMILAGNWPAGIEADILQSYRDLSARAGVADLPVAVRSSATAEDLPDASFAGQQETYLNVRGEKAVLTACQRCYASLFTDRAISYRQMKGFGHAKVALSIGVQRMVRSDTGGSGVMFSIDTESGFDRIALINAAWGLGENVVQGAVNPDEYQVYKPFLDARDVTPIVGKRLGAKEIKMIYANREGGETRNVPTSKAERAAWVLSDAEILELARMAVTIETHYGQPMDMEWARDGDTGELFIVQARPETVQSRADAGAIKSYTVRKAGKTLLSGLSVGSAVAAGRVCIIESARDIDRFVDCSFNVTSTT